MRTPKRIAADIRRHVGGAVLLGEPLSAHTTYRVGGPAEVFVQPRDSREAAWVYRFAWGERIPLTVIGAGSNVIAPDEGVPGVLLQMKSAAPRITFSRDGRARCDAGVLLHDLVVAAARRGLVGLEPLAGIPGTVGGAVVMNSGTRDADASLHLVRAVLMTPRGAARPFAGDELAFGYRRSVVLGSDWLLLSAEFELSPGDPARSMRTVQEFLTERERKYPLEMPSAGSVFKRPAGDYPGRLIEAAGCKGLRVGDAVVSDRHANFIVNAGAATAIDIMELIAKVRKRVYERTGVILELEQIPLAASPAMEARAAVSVKRRGASKSPCRRGSPPRRS
jgi:UDP-N-acetylmuramate dehydrogenase